MSYPSFQFFSVEDSQDVRVQEHALARKAEELACGTGAACSGEGTMQVFSWKAFTVAAIVTLPIALTRILLRCGRLSLPCVFSCKKGNSK